MKRTLLLALLVFAAFRPSDAVDLSAVPDDDPKALKAALEAGGGSVQGEPVLERERGPDGKETRVIVFPEPASFVTLPVAPAANLWILKVAIRIEEAPYGISSGPMVGLVFGPNDSILAISADKWSKEKAPSLISGLTTLLPEERFRASDAMETGDWRQIVMGIQGNEWHLKVGKRLDEKGTVENDSRSALSRTGTLLIRLGNFAGAATLPVLSEP
jgi:hypothetical protein